MPQEIHRVEGFYSGNVRCVRCQNTISLFYNGGELDLKHCCGLTYRLEHQRTDLVVYEDPDWVVERQSQPAQGLGIGIGGREEEGDGENA